MIKRVCEQRGAEFSVYPYRKDEARFCSRKCYHDSTRMNLDAVCEQCGKIFRKDSQKDTKRFCSNACVYEYKRSRPRKATVGKDGYKYIWWADGTGTKEHIYIMEQSIGRKLRKDECVHHIDGNRQNNDLSNLRLMTRGDHSKLHREKEKESGKAFFGRRNGD